jgi:hypothetical protein
VSLRLAALSLLALTLSACAMAPLPPPQASLDNIQALRRGDFAKVSVGAFTPAPGAPAAMDRRITVRAGSQAAPKASGGSYARYLGDTLAAELAGAARLDAGAPLVISGVITQAHVDSGMPSAHANLSARFTLKHGGTRVFEKEFAAQAEWKSSLIGAVAIPDAFNHYLGLFPQLVAQLLADPDFKAAAKAA